MKQCQYCYKSKSDHEIMDTHKGYEICEDCASNRCYRCLDGEQEHESSSGHYICSDCLGFEIDRIHDYMKGD